MPGRDGTGPQGLGTMTGRAAGCCAGKGQPDNSARVGGRGCGQGLGRGQGRGLGRGLGMRNRGVPAGTPANEDAVLAQQETALQTQLDAVRQHRNTLNTP